MSNFLLILTDVFMYYSCIVFRAVANSISLPGEAAPEPISVSWDCIVKFGLHSCVECIRNCGFSSQKPEVLAVHEATKYRTTRIHNRVRGVICVDDIVVRL